MGTLHEDVSTFLTISRYILLKMRIVLDKSCREIKNTHFVFNNVFVKITPFMRTLKNVETEGPQMMLQYGTCALCAGLARLHAHIHMPGYPHACMHTAVIRERASVLRYTYIVPLFVFAFHITVYSSC